MNKTSPEESTPSTFKSGYDEVEYWSSYAPKCEECKVMLKQLRQMKQTVKTLININQEQYWTIVDYKEDSERLVTELQQAKWRAHLLEAELARVKSDLKMVGPEKPERGSEIANPYISKRHSQLKSPASPIEHEKAQTTDPGPSPLTERIKELMNSSMERPVNIPFKFDTFSVDQRADPSETTRLSEYKALANIFTGTAAIDDKPQMSEPELPLVKRLEKELREGIAARDVEKVAETLLKVKEDKLQDLVDIDTAQRKLEELLTAH